MRWISALLMLALAGCALNPPAEPAKPVESAKAAAPAKPAVDPKLTAAFAEATALLKAGKAAEAARALESLTADQPQWPGAWVNLGLAYAALDKPAPAQSAFERALALKPAQPEAANGLAILHRRAGRFGEARALYETLLTAHPDHAVGHRNLGILCELYLQDLGCAAEHYTRYQTLSGDTEADKWLADIKRRQGGSQ